MAETASEENLVKNDHQQVRVVDSHMTPTQESHDLEVT